VRVLLCYKCSEDGRSDFFERILPVGLCSLHAVLRAGGHDCHLANFSRTGWRTIAAQLRETAPEVVGISTFTFNRHASLRLAALVKRVLPHARVVLGGPHPSHLHRQLLNDHPDVDFIVRGEGEATLPLLLDALATGADPSAIRGLALRGTDDVVDTGWPEPIASLDSLPAAAEGFAATGVDPRTQLTYLITSRGCPAKCTFCNTPEFWGTRIRFRSVDHVLRELRHLREQYGLLYVSFRDDTFTVQRKRILELAERMRAERLYFLWDCQSRVNAVDFERLAAMRRAGCVHVQYGVESGSRRMLERIAKDIRPEQIEQAAADTRRAGLVFSVYLITGVEGETELDVQATVDLLERIRPHDAMVTPLAVFPGTGLWEERKRRHGETDAAWSAGSREDVYVRAGDPDVERSLTRIGATVEALAARSAYGAADYRAQREAVGDCHALDLAEAELHALEGRTAQALDVLHGLLRREPDNPWGHLRLGEILLESGRPREAEPRFAELVALVPRFAEGHALRARALLKLRRREEAAAAYAAVRALDPHHAGAARALRRLGLVEASAPIGPRPSGTAALVRN
jgi:radical SAM superfamily enzyme YgiQ (UPF0313 family)